MAFVKFTPFLSTKSLDNSTYSLIITGISVFSKELKLDEILEKYSIEKLIITEKDKKLKEVNNENFK